MGTYKAVDAEQLDAGLTTVADALRAKSGSAALLSFPDGMAAEADAVFDAGRKAEYDAFWDIYQGYGDLADQQYLFSGPCWTDENFYPKYDIVLSGSCTGMFRYSSITDLTGKLDQLGLQFDASNCTSFVQVFQGAKILHIPEIDLTNVTSTTYAFGSGAKVQTIDKLIFSENTVIHSAMFSSAADLVSVVFDGVIGASIDLHWSPLNQASILSLVSTLSDSAAGQTASLSLAAVNAAFETAEGAADGTESEEWLALAATKSNWTISLA